MPEKISTKLEIGLYSRAKIQTLSTEWSIMWNNIPNNQYIPLIITQTD